jgi:hypothetical protein
MGMNFGPIEVLVVLFVWALPIILLIWFIRTIIEIRDVLRRIDTRLERLETGREGRVG